MFDGADIGLCGPAYTAPMLLQDAQSCINWFLEVDKNPKAKMPFALLGAPGLSPVIGNLQTGAVRGAWVLPGNQQCLFVVSATVYLVTVTTQATQTSIAQFSVAPIFSINTNNGRVVIRDNGVSFNGLGGYAVLVDGQYGYFYALSGLPTTITFAGNTTLGSGVISFPAGVLVPNGLVIAGPSGTTNFTDSAGALSGHITAISFTANTITTSGVATSNQTADVFTVTIPAFGQIGDPAFLGADRIAFIEGWLMFNQPGTRTFYTNAPIPYTLTFAGLFYALKDSSTDNLITLFENNREGWLIGERTSEVWYNSGGANFAFSRLPGIGPQYGCSAKHSIARVGANLCWLGQNEQGQNIVVMTNQYSVDRISNHAVEVAISSYPQVSDAIGDCYEEGGHVMYVLTFPTADTTWVFDLTTSETLKSPDAWWQRLSWNATTGTYHRHIGNCFVNFANIRMWGDYQSGQIHQQSRSIYTDNGAPLRCQRRAPHVWARENRKRIFQASMQVEFTPGVGLQAGQGVNPQAMIRWSDDGGFSYGTEVDVPIGLVGDTRNRAIVWQCGEARDRVWEVNYSDPTARDIIGATLFGEAEDSEGS
jgi:hypothetical protein